MATNCSNRHHTRATAPAAPIQELVAVDLDGMQTSSRLRARAQAQSEAVDELLALLLVARAALRQLVLVEDEHVEKIGRE